MVPGFARTLLDGILHGLGAASLASGRALRSGLVALALAASLLAAPAQAQRADVFDQRVGTEVDPDTVQAGRFDDGRMWTFADAPLDAFARAYRFQPSEQWLDRARLGALRIPGCSASFVSASGLVLTNHHCAREHVTAVQRAGESLAEEGFYATSVDRERRVPGLYADQLVRVEDVTAAVDSALAEAQTDAERADRRQEAIRQIQARLEAETEGASTRVDVTALYSGARHVAHVYRRYTDVRLVFAPEEALGYFGGDTDNFTYPRYALDMAFLRVYAEDGTPLVPEHHFQWAGQGADRGEPVFVVGNPGSTLRLETADQLAFRRDVQDAHTLRYFQHRANALAAHLEAADDPAPEQRDALFVMRNVVKLYAGRVEALNDAYIMARIRKGDANLRSLIQESDQLRDFRGVLDSMRTVQEEKREWAPHVRAFYRIGAPRFGSATLARAWAARTYAERQQAGAPDSILADLRRRVRSVPSQPGDLDRRLLTARLREVAEAFAADTAWVDRMLDGQSPANRAAQIQRASAYADSATAADAVAAAPPPGDPAAALVAVLYEKHADYRSAWSGLQARQQQVARRIGQAHYAAYGDRIPPDATFTLRIADGRVQGYPYNGTVAPHRTTFYGMYGHFATHGPDSEWHLPKRWQAPPEAFDRSTPVNMVATNDITGGNSGSPVLNRDLELVGLAFDGNIESLAGDYIYLPGRMRTVAVDVRGMLEALDEIYDADRLVQEVLGGPFVRTEAAASESSSPSSP
mgnify:FL=1